MVTRELGEESLLVEFLKNHSCVLYYSINELGRGSKACANKCIDDMKFEVSTKIKEKLSDLSNDVVKLKRQLSNAKSKDLT